MAYIEKRFFLMQF